jgi:hypothetical protein
LKCQHQTISATTRCTGSNSTERGEGRLGKAGEPHGQVSPYAPETPDVALGDYPNLRGYGYDPTNSQFSQDKENDPIRLMEQTRAGIDAHANLNESFGLYQPVATLGSHPFLRDELSNPTEREAGNAEPFPTVKLPKRRLRGDSREA